MAAVPKPTKGKKIKVEKVKKPAGKRGRPSGAINVETLEWLEKNNISEEMYKKILAKIRGQ